MRDTTCGMWDAGCAIGDAGRVRHSSSRITYLGSRISHHGAFAFDPDFAAFPDFLLPDPDGLCERVDGKPAGLEDGGTVRAGHGDQDARFPDLEPAHPVSDGDATLPTADRLLRDRAHLPLRHRPV